MKLSDAKMLIECLGNDLTEYVLRCVYFDGKHAYATDGHRVYRCEYETIRTPFLLSGKQLKECIKGMNSKKNLNVAIPDGLESGIPAKDYPQIALLIPATFEHEVTLSPSQSESLVYKSQLLSELDRTAIKFEPSKIFINHGIAGRWLSDPQEIDALNCCEIGVPVLAFTTEYLAIKFVFDKIDINGSLQPVIFRNSRTRSIYLLMPTHCKTKTQPFN